MENTVRANCERLLYLHEPYSKETLTVAYKKAIKESHPDFAIDEEDKRIRNVLTASVNNAYRTLRTQFNGTADIIVPVKMPAAHKTASTASGSGREQRPSPSKRSATPGTQDSKYEAGVSSRQAPLSASDYVDHSNDADTVDTVEVIPGVYGEPLSWMGVFAQRPHAVGDEETRRHYEELHDRIDREALDRRIAKAKAKMMAAGTLDDDDATLILPVRKAGTYARVNAKKLFSVWHNDKEELLALQDFASGTRMSAPGVMAYYAAHVGSLVVLLLASIVLASMGLSVWLLVLGLLVVELVAKPIGKAAAGKEGRESLKVNIQNMSKQELEDYIRGQRD